MAGAQCLRCVETIEKPRKIVVFANAKFVRIASLRARQNLEKLRFRPSKMVPGRSKIGPGATQNAKKKMNMSKKRFANAQEASKSEKKTPKSEK